jgi:hypothetical protein
LNQLDALLAALDSPDRAVRLDAIFRLGEGLEGKAADPAAARVVAKLEEISTAGDYGAAWVRKRAKRALRKIRGTPEIESPE